MVLAEFGPDCSERKQETWGHEDTMTVWEAFREEAADGGGDR